MNENACFLNAGVWRWPWRVSGLSGAWALLRTASQLNRTLKKETHGHTCVCSSLYRCGLFWTSMEKRHIFKVYILGSSSGERGPVSSCGPGRRGWVVSQVGEVCLESCECLLSAGQGPFPARPHHVGIGMWLASTVNKSRFYDRDATLEILL